MVNLKILLMYVKIVHILVQLVQTVPLLVLNVPMLENLNQLVNVPMDSMMLMDKPLVEFVKFSVKLVQETLQLV